MIFRMKIEKGCLYSERYRIQHCFDRSTLELSNPNYIIDLFVKHRHLIDTVELREESEIEILNKTDKMLTGINVENPFEKLDKSGITQIQDEKLDDIKDKNDDIPSNKDTKNTKNRRTKKV